MIHYVSPERRVEILINTKEGVYEPSDDTFLLLDSLDHAERPLGSALELGTGTGIIAIYGAKRGARVTATDINEETLALAKENASLNGVAERIEFVKSDLFDNVDGSFDTIIFNPPYLPEEEPRDVALDGGKKGYELAERFLKDMPKHLENDGRCYLLLSSIDKPESLLKRYKHRAMAEKRFFFERLYVFEILL
jgi:release factor glutamine methyltransferase